MRRLCIIVDTREQRPLDFSAVEGVRVERRKIWPGDYSIKAYSRMLAIERKSVSDLVGTMRNGYAGFAATSPKRFDCELLGLGGIIHLGGRAFVLVEPDGLGQSAREQINTGNYQAAIPPLCVRAFIAAIRNIYRIPLILAESRAQAAEIIISAVRSADIERRCWKPFDDWMKNGGKI